MERADQVFPCFQIYADLAPDRTIDLRKQGGGYLHKGKTTQIRRRNEASKIAHHTASEGDDERLALDSPGGEFVVTLLDDLQAFRSFAGRNANFLGLKASLSQMLKGGFAV